MRQRSAIQTFIIVIYFLGVTSFAKAQTDLNHRISGYQPWTDTEISLFGRTHGGSGASAIWSGNSLQVNFGTDSSGTYHETFEPQFNEFRVSNFIPANAVGLDFQISSSLEACGVDVVIQGVPANRDTSAAIADAVTNYAGQYGARGDLRHWLFVSIDELRVPRVIEQDITGDTPVSGGKTYVPMFFDSLLNDATFVGMDFHVSGRPLDGSGSFMAGTTTFDNVRWIMGSDTPSAVPETSSIAYLLMGLIPLMRLRTKHLAPTRR